MTEEGVTIALISIQKGDTIVVTYPGELSHKEKDLIFNMLLNHYPRNKILVFDNGGKISLGSRDAVDSK